MQSLPEPTVSSAWAKPDWFEQELTGRSHRGEQSRRAQCSSLGPCEVHLWTATEDACSLPDLNEAGFLLSGDEREMAGRYWPARRRQFVAGRALTRLALSRYWPVRPQEWVFALSPHGKPAIRAPEKYVGVHFSIAHTEGLTACLISRIDQTAVDVEKIRDWEDLPLVAQRVLSASEWSDIQPLSGDAWYARFFDYWTLKEAYAKARGLGLSLDLTKIQFALEASGEARASFATELGDESRRWAFRRISLRQGYAAAIAVGGEHVDDLVIVHRHANLGVSCVALSPQRRLG
jgi:4'-phosphopantetheinyl transferase